MNKYLALIVVLLTSGCASNRDNFIPESEHTVKEVYEMQSSHKFERNDRSRTDNSLGIKTSIFDGDREEVRGVIAQFEELPNPTIKIYFPSKISADGLPVPAWWSEFKMYDSSVYNPHARGVN
ncbi:hypothetical protein [Vibrio barjaei]|uniref:hypothetical protein n=1 Tax=Vibrio barjaei TaxID=1676683 RepID=UPI002283596B|nr:hypothetical protein [Vibrio barjaei]MCY9874550.1 hypothetical protein [Vibrio barjaei]